MTVLRPKVPSPKKKKKVATILTKLVNFSTFKTQFKHHYILEGFHGVPETRGSPLCPQNALCHFYCCVQLLQLALSFPQNTLAVSHWWGLFLNHLCILSPWNRAWQREDAQYMWEGWREGGEEEGWKERSTSTNLTGAKHTHTVTHNETLVRIRQILEMHDHLSLSFQPPGPISEQNKATGPQSCSQAKTSLSQRQCADRGASVQGTKPPRPASSTQLNIWTLWAYAKDSYFVTGPSTWMQNKWWLLFKVPAPHPRGRCTRTHTPLLCAHVGVLICTQTYLLCTCRCTQTLMCIHRLTFILSIHRHRDTWACTCAHAGTQTHLHVIQTHSEAPI